jgi:CheY-like chemotaxis protein
MNYTFDFSDSRPDAPRAFEQMDTDPESTILIVEDDPDIRDMMSTLLDLAGFSCIVRDAAEAGLAALREQSVDLVLTDYALPVHTGIWLLERAEAEGLIQGTPVMIVTAHPDPIGASMYEVVQKPFDLDDLLNRVKRRMEGNGRRRKNGSTPPPKAAGRRQGQGDPGCPEPVELILYVSSESVGSAAAIRNIEKALARFDSAQVRLTVCDLSEHPEKGAEHRVTFTPTLVRKSPAPRTCILGHLANPDLVLEMLSDCDLEQT